MKPKKITIRKYENRRLYDTSASRYINLDELAAMVRNGNDVEVVDAKTGEDLTRVTLTQIIVEEAKDHPAGLPLELLRQLILASDKVRQEFMMWYLKSAFDSYQKVQTAFQSGLAQVGSAALSPLETFRNLIQGNIAGPTDKDAELRELRARITELEASLKNREGTPRPRRKKAPLSSRQKA